MNCGGKKLASIYFFKLIVAALFIASFNTSYSQQAKIDSLKKEFLIVKSDSLKSRILEHISAVFEDEAMLDSAIIYAQQELAYVQETHLSTQREVWALTHLHHLTTITGNCSLSLQYATLALSLSEQINDQEQIAFANSGIAMVYSLMGDQRSGLTYYFKAKKAFETYESGHWAIQNIAETYLKMHMLDSALYYNKIAYHIADTGHNQQYMKDFAIRVYGAIYAEKGEDELALKYYHQFVNDFYQYNLNNREVDRVYLGIAKIFQKNNQTDSAIIYAKKGLSAAQIYIDEEHIAAISNFLYGLNDSLNNQSEAFKYFKIAQAAKDSMASIEKIKQIQLLTFNEQAREKEESDADAKAAAKTKLIIIISSILIAITTWLIWYRIRQLRVKYQTILEQKEAQKLKTQLLELEASALRAQMNPHFIFNCMNSIKLLMQQSENEKAITYLTTFSKLIRTVFQNSDKREITLYDEIETCKLYTQLESMRFAGKFSYAFLIDETIDLKLLMVPALIIQPFIENAIWHGIMPKEKGGCVNVIIKRDGENVLCIINDDGIGRETSLQNKFKADAHESKGVHLTQSRIDLDNLINQRNASLEVIDKKDEQNISSGTKVILTFKEY